MIISVDFETRSLIDLPKAGLYRYAEDESTDILCMSWAIDDEEPQLWTPLQPFPKAFDEFYHAWDMDYPVQLNAWNACFEIEIWEQVGVKKYGWPSAPQQMWHDTMGDAAMCSFPLRLGNCASAMGIDEQKDKSGTKLINLLSKPIKGTNKFRQYREFPEEFNKLYEYCRQDVRTEREVYNNLPAHVSGIEDEIQRETWATNKMGVPIDVIAVEAIQTKIEQEIAFLNGEMEGMTDGRVTSAGQRDRILCDLQMNNPAVADHLAEREMLKEIGQKVPRFSAKNVPGIKLDCMKADVMVDVMRSWELTDYDRKLLKIYADNNHASVAKFKKMLLQMCFDNTIKGNLQYHGAGTGRDAARGVQLQNMPRATEKQPDLLLEWFYFHSYETLSMVFPVLETASTLIRPMIKAPQGMKLVVSDYGQVEARGGAWTAKEEDILQNFFDGIPIYESQAASMYGVAIELVTALQRQYGKLAVLACGYQGAHKALTKFAENYGLVIERKEAGKVVRAFREARPKLVKAWAAFQAAAIEAVNNPGRAVQVDNCQHAVLQMNGPHLTMELPSGRKLWYPEAECRDIIVKYEDEETGLMKTFKSYSVTFKKLVGTHWLRGGISGGNLFQNYTQAICRDLIMEASLRASKRGYKVIGRIHDELITLVPNDSRYSIEDLNKIMEEVPEWAEGFPIEAAGYESQRYRK